MLLQLIQTLEIFNLVIFALILIIPGYFWTLAFFPEKSAFEKIERIAFSLFFSITIFPMVVLLSNTLLQVPIEFFSLFSTQMILVILSLIIYLVRTQRMGAPQFFYKFVSKIKKSESVDLIPKF